MKWLVNSPPAAKVSFLSSEAGCSPLMARLLLNRGINDAAAAHSFLNPSITQLHLPFSMMGMKSAVERLQRAIAGKETILIYGDYDVDGTVAIVILKTAIELCGGIADFHVPHRLREGYGMKDDVIERAAAAGVTLIISVDTGIRAFAAAETAQRLGLDLIVTDHHLTEDGRVPRAFAVLNPNQPGCEYPCKDLCGAGVAFKIAQALLDATGRSHLLPSFLKIVAIATVSDAVPLTGENRVFTSLGLDGLRKPVNPGLRALLQVASLHSSNGHRRLTAGDVGFRLGPRLNAAGRMDIAQDVIELFTTKDPARAAELAGKLNQLNADRQAVELRIVQEIQERLDADAALRAPYCLVLDGDSWHRGVIGIVATRVVERYGRPALVIARDPETGEAHGSGRSIPAFHLLQALEQESCKKLFSRFGGHAHAVGFALPAENIPALRQVLDSYARACLTAADFEAQLRVDAEISLDEVNAGFCQSLEKLEPFGLGNREPVFISRGLLLRQDAKIMKEKHLKLRISAGPEGRCFDALGWRLAERLKSEPLPAGSHADLAFTVEASSNPDFPGLHLVLRDYSLSAVAAVATS